MKRTRDPLPGLVARYDADCVRCGFQIHAGETRIVFSRGRPIHCECASGADDE